MSKTIIKNFKLKNDDHVYSIGIKLGTDENNIVLVRTRDTFNHDNLNKIIGKELSTKLELIQDESDNSKYYLVTTIQDSKHIDKNLEISIYGYLSDKGIPNPSGNEISFKIYTNDNGDDNDGLGDGGVITSPPPTDPD